MYYDWTDAKTPDIPGDGKMFFTADSWFNVAQAGMKQLGSSLIEGETLNLSGETYAHIFATTYVPAVEGGIAIYDGSPKPATWSARPVPPPASCSMGIPSPTRTTPSNKSPTASCLIRCSKAGQRPRSSGAAA